MFLYIRSTTVKIHLWIFVYCNFHTSLMKNWVKEDNYNNPLSIGQCYLLRNFYRIFAAFPRFLNTFLNIPVVSMICRNTKNKWMYLFNDLNWVWNNKLQMDLIYTIKKYWYRIKIKTKLKSIVLFKKKSICTPRTNN